VAATPVPARAQPAPAPAAGPAPTTPVDVIAVTRDDTLLEQVGRELDGQTGIRLADCIEAADDHVEAGHAQVILLDAREHADLGSAVDRLQSLSESAVVVVFAPESQSPDIANAIRRTAVFAVLPIPVETGKTAAVLEGARDEALSRAVLATPKARPIPDAGPGISTQPPHAASLPEPFEVALAPPARPRTPRWLVPGMIVLVVLGISAAWLTVHRAGQPAHPTSAAAVVTRSPAPVPPQVAAKSAPDRLERGTIEDLLDKAATAFRERRYVEPVTDSALLYYRSVLAQAPDNGEARQGLDRVGAVLDERLQSALADRRFDDAATALAQLALVRPADPKLKAAATRIAEGPIAAALESGRTDRASQLLRQATQSAALPVDRVTYWRDEIGRRQAASAKREATEELHSQADARVPRVATPAPLATVPVPAASVDASATPRSSSEPERLAQLMQQRISEGRLVDPAQDSALYYYGLLRTADPSGAATAQQGRALSSQLMEKAGSALAAGDLDATQRYLAAARQLGVEPTRADDIERRLAAARQPVPTPLQSHSLERTNYVAPVYPKGAQEKGISGEVQVRLTVDAEGHVKAAEIVSSTPAGVFDQSVMAAVIRWRFKAPQVGGRPVEATTVVSVVFKPVDGARR
jgi:TonB family protein